MLSGGTTVSGSTLTINAASTLDVETGSGELYPGATLDGVTVTNDGGIVIGATTGGASLALVDGTTITGGTLTIGSAAELDIETGANGPGATLDGVNVTDSGAIDIDLLASGAILTLDDNTTISGGTLTVGSFDADVAGALDIVGVEGSGATLDGVNVINNAAINVDPTASGAILHA